MLKNFLQHPLTLGLDVDAPETTELRRMIIQEKKFLLKIYEEWYSQLLHVVPPSGLPVLELGAGGGFLKSYAQNKFCIASDIMPLSGLDIVLDATRLPFSNHSLAAILMTNVFHHIPNVESFLEDASRVIQPGGVLAMIEPWNTPWSRFVYTYLHPEPFIPDAHWDLAGVGPLSMANDALPWIVFSRDKTRFMDLFPEWQEPHIHLLMPVSYLLSGGVSLRSIVPGFLYHGVRFMEKLIPHRWSAMFACIILIKKI